MKLIDADKLMKNIEIRMKAKEDDFIAVAELMAINRYIAQLSPVYDVDKVIAELDGRIKTQLKIIAGLGDPVYRYGFSKSLEAYPQCKLMLEDLIN